MADVSDQEVKGALEEKGDGLNGAQDDSAIGSAGEVLNASGHRDQLNRQYGILSICGMALTVDNAWVAIGTSLNVAICRWCQALDRPTGLAEFQPQTMEDLLGFSTNF